MQTSFDFAISKLHVIEIYLNMHFEFYLKDKYKIQK